MVVALALHLYMPVVLVLEKIQAQQQTAGRRSMVLAVAVMVLRRLVMAARALLPVLVAQVVMLPVVHRGPRPVVVEVAQKPARSLVPVVGVSCVSGG